MTTKVHVEFFFSSFLFDLAVMCMSTYVPSSTIIQSRTFDFPGAPLLDESLGPAPVIVTASCATLPILQQIALDHSNGSGIIAEMAAVLKCRPIIVIRETDYENLKGFGIGKESRMWWKRINESRT
jgi:hypothetical protein